MNSRKRAAGIHVPKAEGRWAGASPPRRCTPDSDSLFLVVGVGIGNDGDAAWQNYVDFEGDADDEDEDYDENGKYARKVPAADPSRDYEVRPAPSLSTFNKDSNLPHLVELLGCLRCAAVPISVTRRREPLKADSVPSADDNVRSIPIPEYIPGTMKPFPHDNVIEGIYRKIVYGHYKYRASRSWSEPRACSCNLCGNQLNWHDGDYVHKPYVEGDRLVVRYDFRGKARCRGCASDEVKVRQCSPLCPVPSSLTPNPP